MLISYKEYWCVCPPPLPPFLAKFVLNYSFSSRYIVIFHIFNFWQNFTHILWFDGPSGDACWFLCVIKSIWLLHEFIIFRLSLKEYYTNQVCSCSFLSKDNILIRSISDEWLQAPRSLFCHSIMRLYTHVKTHNLFYLRWKCWNCLLQFNLIHVQWVLWLTWYFFSELT